MIIGLIKCVYVNNSWDNTDSIKISYILFALSWTEQYHVQNSTQEYT